MEQFSLSEYLKNPTRPIVTRDGRSVRIICTDRNYKEFPIVALVQICGEERVCGYTEDGVYLNAHNVQGIYSSRLNQKTKKVGWMNVCKYGDSKHFSLVGGVIHPTREQAQTERPDYVVDTIQIRWEE